MRKLVTLIMAAGLLAGCGQLAQRGSGCPGGETTPVSPGPAARAPVRAESLWVADGGGRLRAIRGDRVMATVDVGRSDLPLPPVLVDGGGLLWAYRLDAGDLALLDPVKATVVRHAEVPAVRPYADNLPVYAHGALWIAQPNRLWRVGTGAKGAVTSFALPAGFAPARIVATGRWLWLVAGRRLLRLDPRDPRRVTEAALPVDAGQVVSAGGLYVTGLNSPIVHRLDPDTGAVLGEVRLPGDELALSLVDSGPHVWAIGNCGNLVRLSDRLAVRVSDVSQDLPAVAALDSLWVGDEVRSEIVRIDPATGRVLARMPFAAADPDDPSFGLVAGGSTVWVLDGDFGGGVSRVDTAAGRVSRVLPGRPGSDALSAVVSTG